MTTSSSPVPSSPVSITRSTNLSARKTYSRKASIIREKRKAEALGEDTDDSDEEITYGSASTSTKGKAVTKDGSPITKKVKKGGSLVDRTGDISPQNRISRSSGGKRLTSARSLPSSPSGSRTPSTSPPPIKKSKSTNIVPTSTTTSTIPKSKDQPKRSAPVVDIHPPSSSPPLPPDARAPSTPPRKLRSLSRTNTPRGSPSAYEDLFSAVSPRKDYFDSPGKSTSPGTLDVNNRPKIGRPGGMRRMLTKSQSMTSVPISPSKGEKEERDVDEDDKSSFGGSMPHSPAQQTQQAPTTPSKSLLRTQSMPESPSRSLPRGTDYTSSAGISAQVASGSGGGSGGRARRTYGGKRSMLAEVSQVNLDIANVSRDELGVEETAPEASYAELRKKYETDNDETQNGSGNLMAELLLARAPQAVSDMRSKGENRRFMDELSCLIEGITDPSMGMSFKRTSAIDILDNMQDESWLAKMHICGQVEKVWESFMEARGVEPDLAMETICMLFLETLQQSNSGIEHIVSNDAEKVLDLVLRNLRVRNGPLDGNVKGKLSNATQKIRRIFSSLQSVSSSVTPSTRLLASTVLIDVYQSNLLKDSSEVVEGAYIFQQVSRNLRSEVKTLGDRFDLNEKGLDLLPAENAPDFDHVYALLQIIGYTLSNADDRPKELQQRHKDLIEDLMIIIIACSSLVLNEEDVSVNTSRCVLQSLQLLLVITDTSPEWAAQIIQVQGGATSLARLILQREYFIPGARPSDDGNEEESQQTEIDVDMETQGVSTSGLLEDFLLTVLAVSIQCIQSGDETIKVIAVTKIDSSCKGKYGCLRKCHCLDALPLTHHLSSLYSEFSDNDKSIFARAIAGYLALVITKLMSSREEMQEQDIEPLPGSSRREKLEGLRASLRGLKYELHQNLKRLLMSNSAAARIEEQESEEEEDEEDEGEMQDIQGALDDIERMIRELI
ncbi:hypothetical protein I203_103982 [Kwoniella mangroviensis CBS 8507]|uniref:uncharacterized protein n=1 Tax=Kwoniella mangroviensis CBS 8507 TaxID=1296122 RepID=UPI00080CF23B|nr:uncharacterized protein I203_06286 [Kwoniella mangroviensis CBS 8507]OCF64555.1 hypothetical protein I203_06286 [Kwoniella mangroviensis CBS 8507]